MLKSLAPLLCCLFLESCNKPSAPAAGSTSSSSTAVAPTSTAQFNAYTLFSAADAQQIMGAPMKVAHGDRAPKVCMYEEVTARPNSIGARTTPAPQGSPTPQPSQTPQTVPVTVSVTQQVLANGSVAYEYSVKNATNPTDSRGMQ